MRFARSLAIWTTALVLGIGNAYADQIYISMQGEKQGNFPGESAEKGKEATIPILKYQYGITVPYDPASGQPRSQRQHKTVLLTKQWGVASPPIFNALTSGERIKTVMIEFFAKGKDGKQKLTHKIELVDAIVVGLSDTTEHSHNGVRHLQTFELTFRKIILTDSKGTSAADDWREPII